MGTTTHRTITTYRWVCTDKVRCEQLDEQIDKLVYHQSKLSSYVLGGDITGLECLVIENKFKYALLTLRNERKTLWRRVPKKTEEEIVIEEDNVEVTNADSIHAVL